MTTCPDSDRTAHDGETRFINAPVAKRPGSLQPSTWDVESRTIEVIWAVGTRRAYFDWASETVVDEELAVSPGNVRLDRLNSGAPVLDNHRRDALTSQIGVVMPGTARIKNGCGIATLKLSDRPELASIVSDIANGIIRNISIGYTVHTYDVEERENARPLFRAIDWEPYEVSFVTVPADTGATVRGATDQHPCVIRTPKRQEHHMDENEAQAAVTTRANIAPAHDQQRIRRSQGGPATMAQLREYFDLSREQGTSVSLSADDRADFILQAAEQGMSMEEVTRSFMKFCADRQREETRGFVSNARSMDDTYDNPGFHCRAIEDALYARLSGSAPTDQARAFMSMSMVQMAGDMLERRGVRNVRQMQPSEVLNAAATRSMGFASAYDNVRAMHTTSDFPGLLTGAGQRFLLDVFAAAASAIKAISRQRSANDFRAISGLEMSGFGTLSEVKEAGEIKHGTFRERKETYALKTFAKQFALSRQAIINDDLGAFGDPVRVMARAAAETEASLFADLINNNPTMGDGLPLFHADHRNLAGVGALPSLSTLSDGRMAMRGQKDLDGVTPLAAAPKFILTSEVNETIVEQLLTSVQATTSDTTNPFAGKLTPLIDPRLSPRAWYLFADPALAPVLEHAYLDGASGPHVEMQEGWDVLGQKFRVYMDFGAGVIDHRGAFKNTGQPE